MTTKRTTGRAAPLPAAAEPSSRAGTTEAPTLGHLSESECMELLARNSVGRLAFAFRDRVDIQPIHYVYENRRLFGRTSPGGKLVTLQHSPWVAFEVDEVTGTFDWRSVVVHGTFYPLVEDGSPVERHARQHAIELLRRIVPLTATRADPVAFRDVVFEIVIDSITGRAAATDGGWPGA